MYFAHCARVCLCAPFSKRDDHLAARETFEEGQALQCTHWGERERTEVTKRYIRNGGGGVGGESVKKKERETGDFEKALGYLPRTGSGQLFPH